VTATRHGERRRKTDDAASYHDRIYVFHANKPLATTNHSTSLGP